MTESCDTYAALLHPCLASRVQRPACRLLLKWMSSYKDRGPFGKLSICHKYLELGASASKSRMSKAASSLATVRPFWYIFTTSMHQLMKPRHQWILSYWIAARIGSEIHWRPKSRDWISYNKPALPKQLSKTKGHLPPTFAGEANSLSRRPTSSHTAVLLIKINVHLLALESRKCYLEMNSQ